MTLERHVNQIADTIAKEINPTFFGNGDTRQQHFSLVYGYHYDQRNYRMFPTQGWNISLELRQNGLLPSANLHLARARVEITKYTELNRRLSLETAIRLRSSLPRSRPPYANNQALGYGGDLVRGYEYYVMDGLDLAVFRTSLQAKVMDHNFYYPKILRRYVKRLKYSNVKAWLSLQNDIGYANDPWYAAGNPLTNRPLYAYGIGLDLILFNTRGIQMSWLRTITGQNGFYVRTRL